MSIRTHFACLTAVVFVFSSVAAKADPLPQSAAAIAISGAGMDAWINSYYQNSSPDDLPHVLDALQNGAPLDKHPAAVPALVGFLAEVFRAHPDQVSGWLAHRHLNGMLKQTVSLALAMDARHDILYRLDPELDMWTAADPIAFESMRIHNATDLDTLWGAFMASGDARLMSPIIDALDDSHPLAQDAAKDAALRQSALWALAGNMYADARIRQFVRDAAATRSGSTRLALNTLLSNYDHP